MLVLLKDNWKLVISLGYAVIVPLYFNQTSKSAVKAMEASQESSKKQIYILKNEIEEQRRVYNQMFDDYKKKLDEAQAKYDEELESIKKNQKKQQKKMAETFKNDESAIDEELQKRYGLTR
jgi:hypothetical protein